MQVTQLNLYPIKSTKAYGVSQAVVQPQGLNFDRELMITEPNGKFITARKDAELYRFSALPITGGVLIQHDSGERCVVRYADFKHHQESEVWGTNFPSWVAENAVNEWLSRLIGRDVQLRWIGEQSQRTLTPDSTHPLSFADSNPILLVSEKSLEQVQQWSPVPITLEQFRGNIVIDGNTPFEEEQWQRVKIGKVSFRVAQSCTRCILITRNPKTLNLDPSAEPFRTLKNQHTNSQGKPIFGIHLVPEESGVIYLGDDVTFLS